jgi:hypothetical protein
VVLRKIVQQIMSDLNLPRGQAHQKLATAPAQPVDDGARGGGREECVRQRGELGDKLTVLAAEEIANPVTGDAPRAAPVGVDVAGVGAALAGEVDVDVPARPACFAAGFGRSHEDPSGAAESAGCRVPASASVTGGAERAGWPGCETTFHAAAVSALVQGARTAAVAVEGAARLPDVLASAETGTDGTNAFYDAAGCAESGFAVLAALRYVAELAAVPADAFRGAVAAFTDGSFALGVGMRGSGDTAADALAIWCFYAGGAHQDRDSVSLSSGVVAVPTASGACPDELCLPPVAAVADQAFWSTGDHPAVLAAARAPLCRVPFNTPGATTSLRRQTVEFPG